MGILDYIEYENDLTEYERDVLEVFRELLKDTSAYYVRFCNGCGEDVIHIIKDNNRWISYFAERGNMSHFREAEDVYDLLNEWLNDRGFFFDENIKYYREKFPSKEEFKSRHSVKCM